MRAKKKLNRRKNAVSQRRSAERLLLQLTSLPTASGAEHRVVDFVESWVAARKGRVALLRDRYGNLALRQRHASRGKGPKPIIITAHMDHPAFVVTGPTKQGSRGLVELEFRGWVLDAYFPGAKIEIFDEQARRAHDAMIVSLDAKIRFPAKPFIKVIARFKDASAVERVTAGCIGRWKLPQAEVKRGILHSHACDDVAGVAAALSAFDRISRSPQLSHVSLLFTRSEEIGFVGAIGAVKSGIIPKGARLVCLETPRSFPHDSPVGAGPIVRVGDKMSVFTPELTNRLSTIAASYARQAPHFKYQRKLMPGGTCEASTFAAYGISSSCLCIPMGNYHNMVDMDGVLLKGKKARVSREFVSVDDFLGLVELIEIAARRLDDPAIADGQRAFMEQLWETHRDLLGDSSAKQ